MELTYFSANIFAIRRQRAMVEDMESQACPSEMAVDEEKLPINMLIVTGQR